MPITSGPLGQKKRVASLLLVTALLGGAVAVAAGAGGTAADPLISKRFVDETFSPQAMIQAETKITQRHDAVYQNAESRLKAQLSSHMGGTQDGSYSATLSGQRFKQGDVIQVKTGSGFLLLAGSADLSCASGKVLDLSSGVEKSSGILTAGVRYLAVENTAASVTVTSPTTVLALEGSYQLTQSDATDYNALADAMRALGLFKGSDTAYGSGYDLELPPTRIQGLILFLRLLGEENAALSTTAACPFSDVPAWCKTYVAYAYEKGYTKGVDSAETRFGTNEALKAQDYVTFLLRALGYRDTGEGADFTWAEALPKAQELGVLTAGEQKLLSEQPFLRAHVIYVSYFTLDAACKGTGETLENRLISNGTLDASAKAIRGAVTVKRLG